jgi:hypothetical protein
MPSTVETTATLQQRSAQATYELCAGLGLGMLSAADLKYLSLALAQVATEEVSRNSDFAERIRSLYLSLLPKKATRGASSGGSTRSGGTKAWNAKLTPVGTVDEALLDPYGPPNPFALQRLYGDEQLPLALARYTPAKLREAVALVQERYPGSKPKKMTKAAIIEYIVNTITMPSTGSGAE